jgi:hypothetical protein
MIERMSAAFLLVRVGQEITKQFNGRLTDGSPTPIPGQRGEKP